VREVRFYMHRPIGVTILAVLAGIAGLFEIWRTLVFLGLVKFTFVGNEVSFATAQWGQALWALLLAAIWFWVAMGLWNMRAYAWSFGIYISLFTLIFSFFAILGASGTLESEFVVMVIAIGIFMYLNYPGVRNQFMEHEMSLLTPDQRAALERAQAANAAAAQAMAAPPPPPAAPPPAAPPPPPAAPPAPPAPPAAPTS
jgi:hypothetical protein